MKSGPVVAGLAHRVAYAIVIGVAIWYFALVPFSETSIPRPLHEWLLKLLDLPIAAVNAILPWQWKGIDVWSSERQPEYSNVLKMLRVHLRVAVPVYVLLFYVPNAVRWVMRRGRRSG